MPPAHSLLGHIPLSWLLGLPSKLLLPVAFSESLILGNKELAVHLKMTRRRIYWVPRSSGGLVNLGLDVDDDMVSGLSYVSRSPLHQNTRKLSSQGISSGHKLDQIFLCPIYSILIFFLNGALASIL